MKEKQENRVTKIVLIGISLIFLTVLLILPLLVIVREAMRGGWEAYTKAITDEYTLKAFFLTLKATGAAVAVNTLFGVFAAWAVTKYHFRGKKFVDRKSTRLNSSHITRSRMPSSA